MLNKLGALALVLTLSVPMPGCLGLGKIDGATEPVRSFDDFTTISQCPSFALFREIAQPMLLARCASCHVGGGRGAGKFEFEGNDAGSDEVAAKNYALAVKEFSASGFTLPTSGEVDQTNALLARINGNLTHEITVPTISDDYALIREWVAEETNNKCVIDPVTGVVTVVTATPSS